MKAGVDNILTGDVEVTREGNNLNNLKGADRECMKCRAWFYHCPRPDTRQVRVGRHSRERIDPRVDVVNEPEKTRWNAMYKESSLTPSAPVKNGNIYTQNNIHTRNSSEFLVCLGLCICLWPKAAAGPIKLRPTGDRPLNLSSRQPDRGRINETAG